MRYEVDNWLDSDYRWSSSLGAGIVDLLCGETIDSRPSDSDMDMLRLLIHSLSTCHYVGIVPKFTKKQISNLKITSKSKNTDVIIPPAAGVWLVPVAARLI